MRSGERTAAWDFFGFGEVVEKDGCKSAAAAHSIVIAGTPRTYWTLADKEAYAYD